MTTHVICPECKKTSSGTALHYCQHCGHSLEGVPRIDDSELPAGTVPRFAGETPTGQSRLAYRLAALILLTMALTTVLDDLIFGSLGICTAWYAGFRLALAIGLLQLRKGAREAVLIITLVTAIVTPLIGQKYYGTGTAVCTAVLQISSWGALLLLLTGDSKNLRLATAVGGYVLFSLVPILGLSLLKVLGVLS